MLINLTPEEEQKIKEIRDSYKLELEGLTNSINDLNSLQDLTQEQEEVLHKLYIRQQALIEAMHSKIETAIDEAQKIRFAEVKTAGTEAIKEHALQQAPLLLEDIHRIIKLNYKSYNDLALREIGIGTIKNDILFINSNYALQTLKEELKLHIEALKDNPDALQDLLINLIEIIESSPFTDNSDIKEELPAFNGDIKREYTLSNLKYFGIMNNQLVTTLIRDDGLFYQDVDGQLQLRWEVNQAKAKATPVPIYVAFTFNDESIQTTQKLTAFDKQVYEAISSQFHNWRQNNPLGRFFFMSFQEIWCTMNGKNASDKQIHPSSASLEKIKRSVYKMRHIDCYMNLREELQKNNICLDDDRLEDGIFQDYLLNCSVRSFRSKKGKVLEGIRINCEPIIYTYNKVKKQILLVPYELLDTSQYTSDSENITEFKGYLLQQISLMKDENFKRNPIILLDTLYKDTGVLRPEDRISNNYLNEATKQKEIRRLRKADRDKIEKLLEAWKDKGWIKKYYAVNQKNEPLREKQQAKGYKIII